MGISPAHTPFLFTDTSLKVRLRERFKSHVASIFSMRRVLAM